MTTSEFETLVFKKAGLIRINDGPLLERGGFVVESDRDGWRLRWYQGVTAYTFTITVWEVHLAKFRGGVITFEDGSTITCYKNLQLIRSLK